MSLGVGASFSSFSPALRIHWGEIHTLSYALSMLVLSIVVYDPLLRTSAIQGLQHMYSSDAMDGVYYYYLRGVE